MAQMTPAQRVWAIVNGQEPDRIPFTIFITKLQGRPYEKTLRERGICMVKHLSTTKISYTDVKTNSITTKVGDKVLRKKEFSTPYGTLYILDEMLPGTIWTKEFLFKTEDDYPALEFLWENQKAEADYDSYTDWVAIDRAEKDIVVNDHLPLEPMQIIIRAMGTTEFCYQWIDNNDEIIKLYNILVQKARDIYPIVANSPFRISNYGGNVTPTVIGREMFNKYYPSIYNEAAEMLHKTGKRIGCHLDADNKLIMDIVAATKLDFIEAFDAGCGVTLGEAMTSWRNKVIWINWPSAWQFHDAETIMQDTLTLIKSADLSRFIIGITEDINEDIKERNLNAIMDGIDLYYQ